MDQNKRFTPIEELLSEVVRNQDKQTGILQQHSQILQQHSGQLEQLVKTFNTGFSAMLEKMDQFTSEVKGLRQDFQ
jgi:hypothetical protein